MAVTDKTTLKATIDSLIVMGGNITATDMNTILNDIVDSYEDIIQEYTTVERDALTPAEGKKIYNTTSNRLEYYSVDMWLPMSQKENVEVDCSSNPNYPEALVGDQYTVTVAGKIGGASGKDVYVGDLVYCIVSNAGGNEATAGANWKVCYSASSTDSPTRYTEVTLSSAEILDLFTTPKTLVAAPGASKALIPLCFVSRFEYNSAAYATNTSLRLKFDDAWDLELMDISQTGDLLKVVPGALSHDVYENVAFQLKVNSGNPTAGNSTMIVGVYYKILSI